MTAPVAPRLPRCEQVRPLAAQELHVFPREVCQLHPRELGFQWVQPQKGVPKKEIPLQMLGKRGTVDGCEIHFAPPFRKPTVSDH